MALAAAGGGPYGLLNGFFGQFSSDRLRDHCDSGIDTVTLSFVTSSPENEPSGLPGTNFAGHCWAGTYKNDKGVDSDLQSNCYWMKQDIPYCKSRGVKILLSIGGESSLLGYSYDVASDENGESFADFLYSAFGPHKSSWKGPRPMDIDETHHTSVDGFDFDIENAYDNHPYIAMINRFRSKDPNIMITGSPQCPLLKPWAYMQEMIQKAKFDRLNVQFYNNPGCSAAPDGALLPIDDDTDITNSLGLSNKFNYDEWEQVLASSDASQGAKIFVGLPASTDAAANGYLTPEQMKYLICKYGKRPHFGGIALWDISFGSANVIDGKSYQEHVLEGLQKGCSAVPTTTSKAQATKTKTKTKTTSKATTKANTTTTTAASARTTLATTSGPSKPSSASKTSTTSKISPSTNLTKPYPTTSSRVFTLSTTSRLGTGVSGRPTTVLPWGTSPNSYGTAGKATSTSIFATGATPQYGNGTLAPSTASATTAPSETSTRYGNTPSEQATGTPSPDSGLGKVSLNAPTATLPVNSLTVGLQVGLSGSAEPTTTAIASGSASRPGKGTSAQTTASVSFGTSAVLTYTEGPTSLSRVASDVDTSTSALPNPYPETTKPSTSALDETWTSFISTGSPTTSAEEIKYTDAPSSTTDMLQTSVFTTSDKSKTTIGVSSASTFPARQSSTSEMTLSSTSSFTSGLTSSTYEVPAQATSTPYTSALTTDMTSDVYGSLTSSAVDTLTRSMSTSTAPAESSLQTTSVASASNTSALTIHMTSDVYRSMTSSGVDASLTGSTRTSTAPADSSLTTTSAASASSTTAPTTDIPSDVYGSMTSSGVDTSVTRSIRTSTVPVESSLSTTSVASASTSQAQLTTSAGKAITSSGGSPSGSSTTMADSTSDPVPEVSSSEPATSIIYVSTTSTMSTGTAPGASLSMPTNSANGTYSAPTSKTAGPATETDYPSPGSDKTTTPIPIHKELPSPAITLGADIGLGLPLLRSSTELASSPIGTSTMAWTTSAQPGYSMPTTTRPVAADPALTLSAGLGLEIPLLGSSTRTANSAITSAGTTDAYGAIPGSSTTQPAGLIPSITLGAGVTLGLPLLGSSTRVPNQASETSTSAKNGDAKLGATLGAGVSLGFPPLGQSTRLSNSAGVPIGTAGVPVAVPSTQPAGTTTVHLKTLTHPGHPGTTVGPNGWNATNEVATSTVYTTNVYTITKCAPTVTDCPVGKITTEILPLYSTTLPVTRVTGAETPAITEPAPMTTSTVYTTQLHTVTSCAPEVKNCPVGQVVTRTIALYTTVCPVTATATPLGPNPAGPAGPGTAASSRLSGPAVPGSSGLWTSVRPSTTGPRPSGAPQYALPPVPGMPSVPSTPKYQGKPDIQTPPTPPHPQAPGVPAPIGPALGGVTVGAPPSRPSIPVTAGVSGLGVSVAGVILVMAMHVL